MAHIIFEEKNKAKEKTAGKLTGKNKEGKKLYSGLRKRKEGRQERKIEKGGKPIVKGNL